MRRDIFQALADPTRRAILSLLAVQSMTPAALTHHFDCSRQAVSKHLKILQECALLKAEQQGREIHYHFEASKLQEVDRWLKPFRQLWDDRFEQLDNILLALKSTDTP